MKGRGRVGGGGDGVVDVDEAAVDGGVAGSGGSFGSGGGGDGLDGDAAGYEGGEWSVRTRKQR